MATTARTRIDPGPDLDQCARRQDRGAHPDVADRHQDRLARRLDRAGADHRAERRRRRRQLRGGVLARGRDPRSFLARDRGRHGGVLVRDGCLEQRRLRRRRDAEPDARSRVRHAERGPARRPPLPARQRGVSPRPSRRVHRRGPTRPGRHRGVAGDVRRAGPLPHGARHHDLDLRLQQRDDPRGRPGLLRHGSRTACFSEAPRSSTRGSGPPHARSGSRRCGPRCCVCRGPTASSSTM